MKLLLAEDSYLLICSDGLSNKVSTDEMAATYYAYNAVRGKRKKTRTTSQ